MNGGSGTISPPPPGNANWGARTQRFDALILAVLYGTLLGILLILARNHAEGLFVTCPSGANQVSKCSALLMGPNATLKVFSPHLPGISFSVLGILAVLTSLTLTMARAKLATAWLGLLASSAVLLQAYALFILKHKCVYCLTIAGGFVLLFVMATMRTARPSLVATAAFSVLAALIVGQLTRNVSAIGVPSLLDLPEVTRELQSSPIVVSSPGPDPVQLAAFISLGCAGCEQRLVRLERGDIGGVIIGVHLILPDAQADLGAAMIQAGMDRAFMTRYLQVRKVLNEVGTVDHDWARKVLAPSGITSAAQAQFERTQALSYRLDILATPAILVRSGSKYVEMSEDDYQRRLARFKGVTPSNLQETHPKEDQ